MITVLVKVKETVDSGHPMLPDYLETFSKIIEVEKLTDLNETFKNIVDIKILDESPESKNNKTQAPSDEGLFDNKQLQISKISKSLIDLRQLCDSNMEKYHGSVFRTEKWKFYQECIDKTLNMLGNVKMDL